MRLILVVATGLAAAAAATAQPNDPAVEGREIAETWCADCHAVGPDQTAATDAAPAFQSLAEDPLVTDAGLATWIADPQHPVMPDPGLSRAQIEAVVAYIRSLAE